MYSIVNGRNARSKTQMYNMHHPFANYCTESLQKSDMKLDYENEIFLNNLHLIPDPLMKNLADTLVTSEKPEKVKKESLETPMPPKPKEDVRPDSALAGITNFFTGVFNMLSGAVFRTRTPDYYDCFDDDLRQGSLQSWQRASTDDKNGKVPDKTSSDGPVPDGVQSDMNNSPMVSSCEEKLNQVKYLLSPKPKPSTPNWRKRPKKVFVEPGSVEESFEDAFAPEDFITLSNDPYIEYYSPPQYQNGEKLEADSPKTTLKVAPVENTDIVQELIETEPKTEETCVSMPENITINVESEKSTEKIEGNVDIGTSPKNMENDVDKDKLTSQNTEEESGDDKHELVSTCEDKLSKLKALLQDKRTKKTKTEPSTETEEPKPEEPKPEKAIPISKPVDKHYKNPHRMLDKRRKMKMKRSIQEDVVFANEIDLESPAESPSTPSTLSSEASLGDYFDELKGRFRSASTTESEDSFQIVFNDTPKRCHKSSDCESEDSFIVFEDDCYTSNDVFGDSDSESDVSDSGCSTMTCKLSHSLSRTVSNLTDDTLYESSDEVDCARVEPVEARGLLMDATRKSLRKNQPAKKVHFSTEPPTVKVMRVWAYAARQARAGHWERYALDRDRFKRRIADVDMAVSWVLKPQHRARVMFQRFMPLWNRQKRQELAEKKEREKQEKIDAEKRAKEAEEKRIEDERIERERIERERVEEERRKEEERVEEKRRKEEERVEEERRKEEERVEKLKSKEVKKVVRKYDRKGNEIHSPIHEESKIPYLIHHTKCDKKKSNELSKNNVENNNNKILNENKVESITEITDKLESSKSVQPSLETTLHTT